MQWYRVVRGRLSLRYACIQEKGVKQTCRLVAKCCRGVMATDRFIVQQRKNHEKMQMIACIISSSSCSASDATLESRKMLVGVVMSNVRVMGES